MILATFRPEFQPPWPERTHLTRIAIPRLSASQAATMVALASQGSHLPRDMVMQLVNRSDGIPLFVEELARAVMETGTGQAIPASLNELLLARLDRLAGRQRGGPVDCGAGSRVHLRAHSSCRPSMRKRFGMA